MESHCIDFESTPLSPSQVADCNRSLSRQARSARTRRLLAFLGITLLFGLGFWFFLRSESALLPLSAGAASWLGAAVLLSTIPRMNFEVAEAELLAGQYEAIPFNSLEMYRFRMLAAANPVLREYYRLIQRSGRLPTRGECDAAFLEFSFSSDHHDGRVLVFPQVEHEVTDSEQTRSSSLLGA